MNDCVWSYTIKFNCVVLFFFHLNVYLFNFKKLENHQFEIRKAKTLGATTTTKNQMFKNNSVIKIQFTIYLRKRNKTTKCFSL